MPREYKDMIPNTELCTQSSVVHPLCHCSIIYYITYNIILCIIILQVHLWLYMHLVFHHCSFVINSCFIIVFLQQQVFCDDYDTVIMCTVDNAKTVMGGCLLFCCCYLLLTSVGEPSQHMRTDLEVLYRTTHL